MSKDNTRSLASLTRKYLWDILAAITISIFTLISLNLAAHYSAVTDEQAHIPAAYSYVMYGNFSLNPEHPPLAKLIAGLSFIGTHYNFPVNLLNRDNNIGQGEWQIGNAFLYSSGNNPDSILFRSRLPLIIFAVILLIVIYLLVRRLFGAKVALLTLFFTALSPTVLAHTPLVATDVIVMNTMTIAILVFISYLKKPSWKMALLAGFLMGIAELSKFSAAILFVIYPLLAILYFFATKRAESKRKTILLAMKSIYKILLIGLGIMYVTYVFQVIHLSQSAQDTWIKEAMIGTVHSWSWTATAMVWLNHVPLMQPVARYIIGFMKAFLRFADSKGANLLGKDYVGSTPLYFPVASFLKTPSPLLLLWAAAVVVGLAHFKKSYFSVKKLWRRLLSRMGSDTVVTSGAIFTILYFIIACSGSLDIGIRHLLPLFPWMSLFSGLFLVHVVEKWRIKKVPAGKIASAVVALGFLSIVFIIFPNYLPYSNELVGGAQNDYLFYNDSNVDWGQASRYLASYLKQHPNITPVYEYYGDPSAYYICGNINGCPRVRFISSNQLPPPGSYFAIGETNLTIDWGKTSGDPLAYLRHIKPIARVGDAIYIFRT
jgi:hypothetical protein